MPIIGNPIYQSAFVVDQFSGNGSTVAFTMSVAPAGVTNVLVSVSGVLQDPSTYGVVGNTITFSAAPPSGTGNISCRYLGIPVTGVTTTAYRTVTEFTATASQTTFTPPSYTVGFINVYLNGVLLGSADYTATNGTTVVLTTGASAGNLLTVESFLVSSVLNAIPNTAGAVSSANIANDVTINFADGSASTPSITNNGDTNTGIFFPAADTIAFTEGGVESMRIDSSGNVGIGTSSPTATLDVNGNLAITGSARRITGDFSNATVANRVAFQTSTANSTTSVFILPSGTGTTGQLAAFNNSDPTNASNINLTVTTTESSIRAGNVGSGTYLPLTMYTNGSERLRIDTSGNLQFNSGYGSVATAYGCRAWVNFNGTGTPAIRASGNVSSITDGGVGTYTINFTTAMPDANYSVSGAWGLPVVGGESVRINTAPTTNSITVGTSAYAAAYDPLYVTVSIFR